MPIDIIPLAAPELGMTRAELLAMAGSEIEHAYAMSDRFFTLLFAYVAAAYIAAAQLTQRQWIAANALYLLSMAYTGYFVHFWFDGAHGWGQAAFAGYESLRTSDLIRLWSTDVINVSLVILSLWFAHRMRRPQQQTE